MSDKCVHTEHCCKKHGCKYNDYNCPVAFGDKPQSFPCEWCLEDRNNPLQERIQQLEAEVDVLVIAVKNREKRIQQLEAELAALMEANNDAYSRGFVDGQEVKDE